MFTWFLGFGFASWDERTLIYHFGTVEDRHIFSKFCQIFFTHIQKGVPSITTVLQGQGVRIAVMPPKGKGKKTVQKKGQDLVEDDTREEQESPEGRPEINLVIGDVPQASQFQPLQLDQPDDDSDGTNSTCSVTGKRTSLSHNFPSEQEERLVEFFKGHECFYNKADVPPLYIPKISSEIST